jgi:starch phosphorylase
MTNNHNLLTFYVNPKIPEELSRLQELSYNLWSTWDKQAIKLFNRIDPIIYRKCAHNPVMLLHRVSAERLQELALDNGFLSELEQVWENFNTYLSFRGYYIDGKGEKQEFPPEESIAYFSMEYGLHESLPIYSGGLGVLAGDYLKAASDLALPVTGFGLLYKYGYFSQRINLNGEQQEEWHENQWHLMPVNVLTDEKGDNRLIRITVLNEEIFIKIWYITIGKIKLYLLDTDIPENSAVNRSITDRLYDADRTMRILQEIVLSFGSMELLDALALQPKVYHLNEGHSAFIIIERLRRLVNTEGYSFPEACQIISNSTIFTTHTPVTAGNEHFEIGLVEKFLKDKIESTGIAVEEFFGYASIPGDEINFWLPALALRFSRYANGVSRLHSSVSRNLWKHIFPNLRVEEIPIGYVTNGVHTQTWLSKELTLLFDRYIGADYLHMGEESSIWQNIKKIPDIEIWEAHQRRKGQMISFIRQHIEHYFTDDEAHLHFSRKLKNTLSPDILTVGFARRFAPYKRANLILQDPERLLALINNPQRPVQFVFGGKAHPADPEGKKLIQNLIEFARKHDIEDRFVFIENYDLNVAKHIVQGVDVWLNTPIKPFEASGTSGMKAGLNGVLNCSVLDGWWPECYDGENGWAINAGEGHESQEVSNYLEVEQIFDLLEGEIANLYYRRNESNLPIGWIQKMKHSIYTVGMGFNLHRMLRQYIDNYYLKGIASYKELIANDKELLKKVLKKEKEIRKYWDKVYIKDVTLKLKDKDTPLHSGVKLTSGDIITAECYAYLDKAPTGLFLIELIYQDITNNRFEAVNLAFQEKYEDNAARFYGEFQLRTSGLQGINIRIKADNYPHLRQYYEYIKWKQ